MRKIANTKIFFTSLFIVSMILCHGVSYANEAATSTKKAKQAEKIYKSVGPNGDVIYSDKPTPGSKEITVPSHGGYHPVPVPKFTPYQEQAPRKRRIHNSIRITSPTNEETIRNTTGEVTVSVSLGARLRGGQHLEYVMDGKTVYSGTQTSRHFKNILRGSHVLMVRISYKSDSIESKSVTFYMHRPIHKQAHPKIKKSKK